MSQLLRAMREGDRAALQSLFPLVYDELRSVARQQRRAWQGDFTLDTTALVHEVYLKLLEQKRLSAENRAHFLGLAAKAMRHVLCNYSASKRRLKRGGGAEHVAFDDASDLVDAMQLSEADAGILDALDEVLAKLEAIDKGQSDVVECRFFGGMSIEDTATALGVSPATVKREWTLARAWLYREMKHQLPAMPA
ncbi:MAG TPA: ECF-type sigma factor [Gemmatimonadaceae bacterium]|nr:ECF-type sigma factor [Gemmatimonadaceae bacterium]